MTRLRYWLTAKTRYNLHSPFLYDLYGQVLFAQAGAASGKNLYQQLVYKFSRYYGLTPTSHDDHQTLFPPCETFQRLLIVNRPHRSTTAEKHLAQLYGDPAYNVSLDLYDAAVLFCRPSMHPQRYLLK